MDRPASELYKRRKRSTQESIQAFYDRVAYDDPCKTAKTKQLTKPVKELHKEYMKENPTAKVSLRTFHRHKPKNIRSVRKMKFRQCLCEICLNPKLKLLKFNTFLERKYESVRELMNETVCMFDEIPEINCVDRKCGECGVDAVRVKLEGSLGEHLGEMMCWRRWEHVKEGKSSRMGRVQKTGLA